MIRQDTLEKAILNALQNHLMEPELCAEFCQEYTRRMNELRMEHNAAISGYRAELEKLEKRRKKLVHALVEEDMPASLLKDDFIYIEKRKEELETLLSQTDEIPVLVHPNMAERYRQEVNALVTALNDDAHRTEAAGLLRSLIEQIVLVPGEKGDGLRVDLYGDLAGILSVATNNEKALFERGPYVMQDKMVAGAGFEPATFRL